MTDTHELLAEVPLPWQTKPWQQLAKQFAQQQLAHAYLLSGAQGLGKALFVHKFARLLLCQNAVNYMPCDSCANCQLGGDLYHPDILHIAPEEGSQNIKIGQIRALSDFTARTSHSGIAKIIVIEQAHKMNISSANALLKTLEEPSGKTYLFLVTDLPGFLSATIRSRCQRVLIPTPSLGEASNWLEGRLAAGQDPANLAAIAGARPLYALSLSASGTLETRANYISSLGDLVSAKASPQALVSLSSKIGESTAVGYLAATSTILIKYLATNQRPLEAGPGLEALFRQFSEKGHQKTAQLRSLVMFNEEVEQARRQLMSGANPNPQLVMESLLWRWSQMTR